MVSVEDAKTSLEARKFVDDHRQDEGALHDLFGAEECATIQIGGKATPYIVEIDSNEFTTKSEAIHATRSDSWYILSEHQIRTIRERLDNLWQDLGGQNENPRTRAVQRLGYEDDAQILTKTHADCFEELREFGDVPAQARYLHSEKYPTFCIVSLSDSLDLRTVDYFGDLVGNYWAVGITTQTETFVG